MLSTVLTYLARPIAYVGAVFTFVWALLHYATKDKAQEIILEQQKEALRANKEAARARRASTLDSERGKLRENDGYRRD